MTYPPGQPGGGYPPGQPYPQTPYPQWPYPPQPAPSPGPAVTAMVLCTLASLCVVWSVASWMAGSAFVVFHRLHLPSWATALDVVWAIGDVLLILGTVFLWARNTAGRVLAVIGLSLELVTVVSLELVAVSAPADPVVRPQTWLIDVFAVLGLAFLLLPGTGAYLKAGGRAQQVPISMPPYPPVGGPPAP